MDRREVRSSRSRLRGEQLAYETSELRPAGSGRRQRSARRRVHDAGGLRVDVGCVLSAGSLQDLPRDLPLFLARAGRDEFPGLNAALDAFLAPAVRDNRPVAFVNHATGPHAFDVADDSPATRAVIRQVLAFMKSHLSDADDR